MQIETHDNKRTGQFLLGNNFGILASHKEPVILTEGCAGSGKTRAILSILLMRAHANPGRRILLARFTRKSLTQTVLATLEEQVFPEFGINIPGGANRENRSVYELENKSMIVPLGADDGQKLYSFEWDDAYVAEAVEFPTEDSVTQLFRGKRRRPGHERATAGQMLLDCNPGPPSHWLNQRAEYVSDDIRRVRTKREYADILMAHNIKTAASPLRRWKRIVTKHFDNPGYWDCQKWDWTEMGREYFDTSLGILNGHLRQRLVDGLWVSATGSVYPEFDSTTHVIAPFPIPPDWPCIIAMDPGYDHPTAILLIAIGPNNRLYVVNEIYRSGTSIQQDAKDITNRFCMHNIVKKKADPHYAFSKTKFSSGKTIADQMRQYGHEFTPWPPCSNREQEQAQIEEVRDLLIRTATDKQPMLLVFDTCTNTINEFQSWCYKRNSDGTVPPGGDQVEDKNNHCLGGATEVWTDKGPRFIAGMVGSEGILYTPWGPARYRNVHRSGWKTVKRWWIGDGWIDATDDHKVMTADGKWKRLVDIQPNELIYCGDGRNQVPPACNRAFQERITTSSRLGIPQWTDPYDASHSPLGPQSYQQPAGQSGVRGKGEAPAGSYDRRTAGMGEETLYSQYGAQGRGVASQRGGAEMALRAQQKGHAGQEEANELRLHGVRQPVSENNGLPEKGEVLLATMLLEGARPEKVRAIQGVSDIGKQMTYDLEVDGFHCFLVNEGFCVSNSMDCLKGVVAMHPAYDNPRIEVSNPRRRHGRLVMV